MTDQCPCQDCDEDEMCEACAKYSDRYEPDWEPWDPRDGEGEVEWESPE